MAGQTPHEAIIANMDAAAVVVDEEWTVQYANQSAHKHADSSLDELCSKPVGVYLNQMVISEDTREQFETALNAVLSDDEPHESRVIALDGGLDASRPMGTECKISPLADESEVYGATIILRQPVQSTKYRAEVERLRELERQTELLADAGGWEYDVETATLYWTKGTREIFGVGPAYEPALEKALEFFLPDDRETIEKALTRCIETESPFNKTLKIYTVEEEQRWIYIRGEPVSREDGVLAVRGAIRDITEQREREQELRVKTRAIENAPVGITISDPGKEDNPLVYANTSFTDITGWTIEEALGKNCRYLQGEKTDSETVTEVREAIDNEEPVSVEMRNYTRDGTEFWNNLVISPVFDDTGELTNYVGFQQDVTEKKRYRQKLKETSRQLEVILDTIQASVFLKDTDSRYLLMNQECRDLLGVDESQNIVGMTDYDLFPDDVAERVRSDDRRVFETGEPLEIEEQVPGERGTRTHLTRKSPIYDNGGVSGLCAVSADISTLKQRERDLEQFAYAASHDLREPLRVITNYLGLLERRHGTQLDDDATEYMEYAVDAAERMKDVIEGLLAYARLERRQERFEPTDLNDVLDKAMANLEVAIETSNATITTEELPVVEGDATQLSLVFQNLLDNAITYTDEGPPEIDVSVAEGKTVWIVTVTDNGIGMDPDHAERAFDLLERLHGDEADGIGMGLALCQRIVERHEGTIWLDTEVGEGTAVSFTIPKQS